MSSTLDNPGIDPQTASMNATITRYGLIGGLVFIVYALIGILTGISSPGAGFGMLGLNLVISLVLYVGLMVVAVRFHRDKELGGFIAFGRAFAVAFLVALIAGLLSQLFSFVYMNYIDPEYLKSITEDMEGMYERLGMNEEQIEAAMEQLSKSMTPSRMLIQGLIYQVVMGGIVAAIVAAVMKKNRPEMV